MGGGRAEQQPWWGVGEESRLWGRAGQPGPGRQQSPDSSKRAGQMVPRVGWGDNAVRECRPPTPPRPGLHKCLQEVWAGEKGLGEESFLLTLVCLVLFSYPVPPPPKPRVPRENRV